MKDLVAAEHDDAGTDLLPQTIGEVAQPVVVEQLRLRAERGAERAAVRNRIGEPAQRRVAEGGRYPPPSRKRPSSPRTLAPTAARVPLMPRLEHVQFASEAHVRKAKAAPAPGKLLNKVESSCFSNRAAIC